MTVRTHVITSSVLAVTIYAWTNSVATAVSAFISGILIDLDHLLDFFLLSGESFSVRGLFSWCNEGRWERLILIFHSYELYFIYGIFVYNHPHPILTGILLGTGLHLLLDQAGNRHLTKGFAISHWFYFLIFRGWGKFHKDWLRKPKNGPAV